MLLESRLYLLLISTVCKVFQSVLVSQSNTQSCVYSFCGVFGLTKYYKIQDWIERDTSASVEDFSAYVWKNFEKYFYGLTEKIYLN